MTLTKRIKVIEIDYSIVIPISKTSKTEDTSVKWQFGGKDNQKVLLTTSKVQLLELLHTLTVVQGEIDLLRS